MPFDFFLKEKKVTKHAFGWRYFLLHFFPWRQPRVCRTPALIERSEITRRLVWALNCISWWPKGVLQYLILIKTSAAFCHNWAFVFGFGMLRKPPPPLIPDDCTEVVHWLVEQITMLWSNLIVTIQKFSTYFKRFFERFFDLLKKNLIHFTNLRMDASLHPCLKPTYMSSCKMWKKISNKQ